MDFRLDQHQTARLPRLLHLEYTLTELAEELDIDVRHLRHALEVGAPCKETRQTIYVVGDDFRDWYFLLRESKKIRLQEGEFYCLACGKAVLPDSDTLTRVVLKNRVIQERAACPLCQNRINRFQAAEVD